VGSEAVITSTLKIVLVDDHQMFREGVKFRLDQERDFQVIGEAGSAAEAISLIEQTLPDIVVLDIRLPDKSGIELARVLRDRWSDLKILMLTGYDFDQYVRALARLGIDGYVLKDSPQEALVQAIRDIGAGGVVLPPNIASKVMRGYTNHVTGRDTDVWELTLRELDVLELLFEGLKNAEIASKLSISIRTVEVHVRNLMSKLGAQSRTDAVRIALDRGLIK
jgi:DNA-binding NarL/FixJ family response regulator